MKRKQLIRRLRRRRILLMGAMDALQRYLADVETDARRQRRLLGFKRLGRMEGQS